MRCRQVRRADDGALTTRSRRLPPLTPDFHHWHHASDDEAIDKNYAAHYAFLDYLFGTAVKSKKVFPETYGVVGDYMPDGFVKQQMFPFRKPKT